MKVHLPAAMALVATLVLGLASERADAHRHEVATASASTAVQQHEATPELIDAMGRVRDAVEAFEHARHGHMGPVQVRALATHLDAQITHAFSSCRLPPDADASLHTILAIIAKASRAMHEQPERYEPVAAMERALADYARVFNDPLPIAGR